MMRSLSVISTLLFISQCYAFVPQGARMVSMQPKLCRASSGLTSMNGLFGKTDAEIAADEAEMEGMSEQERLNWMSYKQTKNEADVMTAASLATMIPLGYLLWVAFFSE
uniref:Uncharacterized protein n=1 Tax=Octactis speculum TaxID=3111310 RepID=A0A7S2CPN2_9STRA|mmetsp:Transcript_38265/g.51822  ORF Transcript_38265/g.51822 Transcript_38265/m.51822 type:complete len:109 (+) Transcript_38265:67-393(+)|eukprot:CAMPEP_0185768414 /NCGR_PEP_ID=MMETSP1174-20130828/49524_1 /TAXON_ID=35687 /ORGANISM="Dictyocha speculum, Strain CCMP1381" /LENGTH=108 /DNA_ID=CAMNT_0028453085 /DNA_START=63 /DNA_END=389 /DNA_ORIENTATION=+